MKLSKFEVKIYAGIALVVLALLPIIIATALSLRKVIQAETQTIERYATTMVLTQRIRGAAESEFAMVPAFVLSGNHEIITAFDKTRISFLTDLRSLTVKTTDPIAVAQMDELRTIDADMYRIAEPGFEMRQNGASPTEVHDYFQRAHFLTDRFIKKMDEFQKRQEEDFEEAKANVADEMNSMLRLLIIVTILGTSVAAFAIAWLVRALQLKRQGDDRRDLQLVEEIRVSNARKETVEIVSHDLKNPLSTIMMSLEFMEDEPALSESLRHDIQIARRSARSMQILIRDLLDRAKFEAGQFDLDLTDCDVAELLDGLKTSFEPAATAKNVKLSVIPSDFVCVIDCARIEQVLSNLVGNAIKFTPIGGQVELSARLLGTNFVFSVSDSGPGIPQEQVTRIFERFYQSKATAKLGSGLGLSIAKSIVEAHGGRIWVESEHGHGSRFHFAIPVPNAKLNAKAEFKPVTGQRASKSGELAPFL
jgi:signal transduction histidine kinase